MIDLDEIRGYDEALGDDGEVLTRAEQHRRALLAYVDALREAAGKVTCKKCGGMGDILSPLDAPPGYVYADCPDCAALRALLSPEPPK